MERWKNGVMEYRVKECYCELKDSWLLALNRYLNRDCCDRAFRRLKDPGLHLGWTLLAPLDKSDNSSS